MLRQSAEAGVARATYCNFWYAPWDLLCVPAGGAREAAVNTGWNALMDASYVDISMQLSFSRFRQFFTKPPVGNERDAHAAANAAFGPLAERLPLRPPGRPHAAATERANPNPDPNLQP